MQIFVAAPFFNDAERDFNARLALELRQHDYTVWLAQETPFITTGSRRERHQIYQQDIAALENSDLLVAVLHGPDVDAGTAFEVGYAIARHKPVVGFKTDYRTFSRLEEVNLMLEAPMTKICRTLPGLLAYLATLSQKTRKRFSET